MGYKERNQYNIVEFAEGQPEELQFVKVVEISGRDGKEYEAMEVLNAMGEVEHYFLSGHLRYLLTSSEVKEGDKIRVTYKGLSPKPLKTEYGEKKIHQYKLEVWED